MKLRGTSQSSVTQETIMKRVIIPAVIALIVMGRFAYAENIWHVKAVDPNGQFIDIKALDKDGNIHDVKAIEDGDLHIMDIKAVVDGEKWPVKIVLNDDHFAPVKAISPDGKMFDIKALTPDGKRLDVKGICQSGNIIHIKAIGTERAFYGVKAISPEGKLHDVKGVKMSKKRQEGIVNGVAIEAHIKALPPGQGEGLSIWHVKAIHPDGQMLNLKARDKQGKLFDVKALAEAGNQHLFDIKAFVGKDILPVKVVCSDDKLARVKAIGKDGTIYDIKALLPDKTILDVKGVKRAGSIIHIKAVATSGDYYAVKAISRSGKLYDVKGVKMSKEKQEGVVRGVAIQAHLKALPPISGPK
jgi:hypothetical protein